MVRLLRHHSLTSLVPDPSNLRRAFSEASLQSSATNIDTSHTFIAVNQTHFTVGDKILVTWNINAPTSEKDWIGLFYVDEASPENALDTRRRGIGKKKQGNLIWTIAKDTQLQSAINHCHLVYFYGLTTVFLAKSRPFCIGVPLSLLPKRMPSLGNIGADSLLVVSISGLSAKDLKKGFFGKPNPYVRMCIVPRFRGLAVIQKYHGQQAKTIAKNNTVQPSWKNEVYVFHATPADFLEIEVRNKSGKGFSKFLGKVSFPLCTIMDSCGYNKFRTVTQPLTGRNPSEKVQGSFQFTIFIRKSGVPKGEQESGETTHSSPRRHKPIGVTSSVPLDDMALPSGQPIAGATSRRPLSYHPATSYQMHCATAPRSQNYTTNYFESAAFRGQGHSSQASDSVPQRNRTSNSLCQENLAPLSSEDESDSHDEGETDAYEEGNEVAFTDTVTSNSEASHHNGHGAEGYSNHGEHTNAGDSEQTTGNSSDHETKSECEINSENTGTRLVSPLLRFTDPGPSFEEFVEQQNRSSENQAESSSENSNGSYVDNSELASSDAIEQIPQDHVDLVPSSLPEGELSAALSTESESPEVPTDSGTTSVGKVAVTDQQEESAWESSDTSASADDGGDSAEHGYVEFEPGYADGQSDTESQCSDVEEDEIYIGDDIPIEDIESTIIDTGDLLNECLDMLGAVGYTDIHGREEDARLNEVTGDVVDDNQAFDENSKSTEKDTGEALALISSEVEQPGSSPHIESCDNEIQPVSEEAPAAESKPVAVGNDESTENVPSAVESVPPNSQFLHSGANESNHSLCEAISGDEVQEMPVVNIVEDGALSIENNLDVNMKSNKEIDVTPKLPAKERYKQLKEDSHHVTDESQKYRKRSYYKAVVDASPDKESESQKLSKLNSALNSLLSANSQNKEQGNEFSDAHKGLDISHGDEAVSRYEDLPRTKENKIYLGKATSSPVINVPVSLASGVANTRQPVDVVPTVPNLTERFDKSEDSAFSLRHRILRDDYDTSAVTNSSGIKMGIDRHQISKRTDVEGNCVPRNKLKYSTSDPLSSNKAVARIPLNGRLSDQLLVSSKVPPSKLIRDSLIFRSDLPESSVDDIETSYADSAIPSGQEAGESSLSKTSSSNVMFDPYKLKDVSVKNLRETAILSSSEDLTSGSSKNKPIGRSDQPVSFQEITLPTTSSAVSSGVRSVDERNSHIGRNEKIEHTAMDSVKVGTNTPYDSQRREKQRPPPVPARNSSLELALQLENRSRGMPLQEPAQAEVSKDPFQNVTVRKEKRSKAMDGNLMRVDERLDIGNKIGRQPEELKKYDPSGSRPSQPSSIASATTSRGPSIPQSVSYDPTGATKPRFTGRATAIKRSTHDVPHDATSGMLSNKGARLRDMPIESGTRSELPRVPDIEHKSRIRSPSEPPPPVSRIKHRSTSEPQEPQSSESSQPPVIPPRSNRPNQISRSKPAPSKVATKVSIPSKTTTPGAASHDSARSHAEVQRRVSNDPIKDHRDNRAAPRASRDTESIQVASRSPAILHSDSQSHKGDGASSKRPENQRPSSDENEEPLPPHWERAIDSHGRLYYIDHLHRTTTWKRPRKDTQAANEGGAITTAQLQQQHLQQYDRRYQSLRRTIRGQRRAGESNRPTILPQESRQAHPEVSCDGPRRLSRRQHSEAAAARPKPSVTPEASSTDEPTTAKNQSATPTSTAQTARSHEKASFEDTPGCRFIRRRDFFQFVNNHGIASQFINRSGPLKQTLNRIRADASKFESYQHSRDLITLLNFFSDPTAALPPGWEKKTAQNGQTYFIDHSTRSTTFIDPRLPTEETSATGPRSRTNATYAAEASHASRLRDGSSSKPSTPSSAHWTRYQASPQSASRRSDVPTPVKISYNERVVAFLRQPGIEDVFRSKECNLKSKNALRRKIMTIQRDGIPALDRYSNDIELVMLLSIFEDEIESFILPSTQQEKATTATPEAKGAPKSRKPAPYRRDFETKLRTFHKRLSQEGYGQGPGKIRLKIRRDHVVSDAFEQLMKQLPRALQKDRLYIKFLGEEGLDYGGPAREFFFLISRQCFDPYYGLFEYSASDTYTLQISPVAARFVSNSDLWLRFCGRIIALSLVHQHLLDVFFTRSIYKTLLQQSYDLSDLESFDPEFHQSLSWILENDITDVLDMYFTTDEKVFDQVTERPLKPGGESILVTEENKREYVELMIKWRMERGVGEQMKQLVHGFNEVLPPSLMSIFDARELELVIAGTADIDVKDWRTNTDYRSGYQDKHPVVQWFWKAVDSFNNEQRLRLLQFVTGTSSIPFEGFSALRGSTGPRKFTIDCWGDPTMLPRAHTCFNRLDLPPYRNFEELYEKLLYAVEETSSFGIE